MKKLISLLASLSLAATMVAPVFAADATVQSPVAETTVVEYTAADFASATGITLEGNQKGFLVTANVSGLDLINQAGSGFSAAKRTGVLLTTVDYRIELEDSAKLVNVIAMDDGLCPSGTGMIRCAMAKDVTGAYPTVENGDTTGKTAKSAYLNTFAVVTDGAVNATVIAEFVIVPYTSSSAGAQAEYNNDKKNVSYTVNGVAGSTISFGAAAAPAEPNAVITKVELAEGVMGAAWDVTIENYDSEKDYIATFTATDAKPEEAKPAMALTSLDTVAETDGDISFAVLLKLTKARAGLALGIEIK